MILLIDNYDSFVFNLARYVRELGEETVVRRHDATSYNGLLPQLAHVTGQVEDEGAVVIDQQDHGLTPSKRHAISLGFYDRRIETRHLFHVLQGREAAVL